MSDRKSLCQRVGRFIEGHDFFGVPFQFYIKGEEAIARTLFGGFISLLIKMFLVFFFIFKFLAMFDQHGRNLNQYSKFSLLTDFGAI